MQTKYKNYQFDIGQYHSWAKNCLILLVLLVSLVPLVLLIIGQRRLL